MVDEIAFRSVTETYSGPPHAGSPPRNSGLMAHVAFGGDRPPHRSGPNQPDVGEPGTSSRSQSPRLVQLASPDANEPTVAEHRNRPSAGSRNMGCRAPHAEADPALGPADGFTGHWSVALRGELRFHQGSSRRFITVGPAGPSPHRCRRLAQAGHGWHSRSAHHERGGPLTQAGSAIAGLNISDAVPFNNYFEWFCSARSAACTTL